MVRVCHLSSAHNTYDTRILLKECCSLSVNGYDVYLVIPGLKDEIYLGVKIKVIKKRTGRISRMTLAVFSTFIKALRTKAKIYHFHDPELFFVGLFLKLIGKKVIFDVHENISAQIKNKDWLPLKGLISRIFIVIDYLSAKLFYLILAEDSYAEVYQKYKPKYETVLNLPDSNFLDSYIIDDRSQLKNELFYVGSVTFNRGIDVVIEALCILTARNIDFRFHCIGPYEESVMSQVKALKNYSEVSDKIIFYNTLKLSEAYEIAKNCKVGLSVLRPIENYKNSYSTKIFEYMAVKLPLITSDFELYKNVVERFDCGICVDPLNTVEIADAIEKILNDHVLAKRFGENGRSAVLSTFNWKVEEQKLLTFYQRILDK